MENVRKYIWSAYLLFWVYFLFLDSSYEQGDHLFLYLFIGWIPFVIAHFIWRDKKTIKQEVTSPETTADNGSEVDKRFKLLFKVVDKQETLTSVKLYDENELAIAQKEKEIDDFYKEVGHSAEFFDEGDQSLDLDVETLGRYWKLKDEAHELHVYYGYLGRFLNSLDVINNELEDGLGVKEAKKKYQKLDKKNVAELQKMQVGFEFSRAIGEVMLEGKRKHGANFRKANINMEDIKKQIYERHPEWKEE